MKLEVANLRTEQATQLSNMRTEIQGYMNGSFMRAGTVEAHLKGYDARLRDVEARHHHDEPLTNTPKPARG
jgi:hypothetical protein